MTSVQNQQEMRYYDRMNGRLIYCGRCATPNFWDDNWESVGIERECLLVAKESFITRVTREYISPEDGVILEGGCGSGVQVASLYNEGYRVIGVDFATKTVLDLNKCVPELDIRLDDVRDLSFEDEYFIAYWSLGVIEHFWDGYEAIAKEMWRVIAKNGYLFLAFPYMNQVRRLKANLWFYPSWNGKEPAYFYQFALNQTSVKETMESIGFKYIGVQPFLGRQGMVEETPRLASFMEKLYTYKGRNLLIRAFRKAMHEVVSRLLQHFSYSVLLIFEKNG